MDKRQRRLYYFTIEDDSILREVFTELPQESLAITYKVVGTDSIYVTTADSRDAMDHHDVPYTLLGEEDPNHISLLHTQQSREELGDLEEAVKALALAYRSIAMACVGINGDANLGFDLSDGARDYTYFTAPAGHTFIWRMFSRRKDAEEFIKRYTLDNPNSVAWAESIPLEDASELSSF